MGNDHGWPRKNPASTVKRDPRPGIRSPTNSHESVLIGKMRRRADPGSGIAAG
jgi:hypothetical protein